MEYDMIWKWSMVGWETRSGLLGFSVPTWSGQHALFLDRQWWLPASTHGRNLSSSTIVYNHTFIYRFSPCTISNVNKLSLNCSPTHSSDSCLFHVLLFCASFCVPGDGITYATDMPRQLSIHLLTERSLAHFPVFPSFFVFAHISLTAEDPEK